MADLAEGICETLPACRFRPSRLRIPAPRNLGKCSRPESPRATQPQPPCVSSPACGPEEVSLRGREFYADDVSGLGARFETSAGLAGRNSRPYSSGSNALKEPESFRGNRLCRVAHESGGRTVLAAPAISGEDGGNNVSPAELARGIARGEGSTFDRTRAARGMGFLGDA